MCRSILVRIRPPRPGAERHLAWVGLPASMIRPAVTSQARNKAFDEGLLLARRMIFGVLRQVAMLAPRNAWITAGLSLAFRCESPP